MLKISGTIENLEISKQSNFWQQLFWSSFDFGSAFEELILVFTRKWSYQLRHHDMDLKVEASNHATGKEFFCQFTHFCVYGIIVLFYHE